MIAKGWRDARWKFLVAAVPVVLLVFLLSPYEVFVEVASRTGQDPVEIALRDLSDFYYLSGFFILLPLAALLGVVSISGEVSNGTIFLLLSRPMSRTRLLLTKYAIGASTLLVAAVLGKILLVSVAAVREYPIGQLRALEAVLSVLVLWLGVLSVLGTAFLILVVLRSVIASVVALTLTLFLIIALPSLFWELAPGFPYNLSTRLALLTYWMPAYYYYDDNFYGIGGFAITNFLVCIVAAVMPLAVALWMFNKKAY